MTDGNEQLPEHEPAKDTRPLRRDLLLGAAVLIVLFVIFRHHDNGGDTTPSRSPAPTHVTTG